MRTQETAPIAVFDVGSNSVLVHVALPDLTPRLDLARVTRLGQGLSQTGVLSEAAMERTLGALAELKARALEQGAEVFAAVGTQALRVATNAQVFVSRVALEVGLHLEVIPGPEEARLSFLAACPTYLKPDERIAILDVGGGSTELAVGRGEVLLKRESVPLGALALTETELLGDPPSAEAVARTRALLLARLGPLAESTALPRLVGIGGAVTTLAALHLGLSVFDPARVEGARLSRGQIGALVDRLAGLTVAERQRLGVPADRAEALLAGALLIEASLKVVGAPALRVTTRGLRHGVLRARYGRP